MPRTGSPEDKDRFFLYGNEVETKDDTKKLLGLVSFLLLILIILGISETIIPAINAFKAFYL